MREGYLSDYFTSVAAKRLSAVEVDPGTSHQHEFNGSNELKRVLGTGAGEAQRFPTRFVWMGEENEAISEDGFATWYDARARHPTRSEYRLYFPTTDISALATPGDMMFIARRRDGSLMIIISAAGTTIENQLLWLFGIPQQASIFTAQDIESEAGNRTVDFAVRYILEELGIEPEEPETDRLDELLARFGGRFPTTKEFSLFARQTAERASPREEPDATLIAWMEHEEKLFRRLERQLVDSRLREGFISDGDTDVDGFLSFSLSVQNRRKSRAGLALQNHLEEIFNVHQIRFAAGAETENKSKPDFLFPSSAAYHDMAFPVANLTMLGAKTSCKDRWRQVLSEANRIKAKHLLTLEPGISENQTSEMKANSLQLILPAPLHNTYKLSQKKELYTISSFLELLKLRQ